MADVTVYLHLHGYGELSIDVYANDAHIGYLRQWTDSEYETEGWYAVDWYGPMTNPALSLGAVSSSLDGCTRGVWQEGLDEWAASLTDAEWEATQKALYTRKTAQSIRSLASTIERRLEGVSELEPRSDAASTALSTMVGAVQRLGDAASTVVVPEDRERSR